jgi:glycerol-3-phosphate dehydrogenase (NAD(P)+)
MKPHICIIGAGSFGTALSVVMDKSGADVTLWAREQEVADGINQRHQNPSYLSDILLPESIRCTTSLEEALQGAEYVLFATPSHTMREMATKVAPLLKGNERIVTVAKGLETETYLRMSEVLAEVLGSVIDTDHIGVISGPSHAEEVALFKPTTVVVAANSRGVAKAIQDTFMTPMFRIYLNHDIVGVEIAGAVKNIMALAAGIIEGMEMGDNAIAALMTRGLHEMKRMGLAMGASQDTFSGLAGMGDLIVTCTSTHSRNRAVGLRIGKGETLDEIIDSMNMVAEGVKTTASVHKWAIQHHIEMPITAAVHHILFEGTCPKEALFHLMTRNPKDEITF